VTGKLFNKGIPSAQHIAYGRISLFQATPLELARQRYPRVDMDTLRSVLKSSDAVSFIIVRHPLERLLSAYRDKLENALPHTHHEKLGMQIVLQYRSR